VETIKAVPPVGGAKLCRTWFMLTVAAIITAAIALERPLDLRYDRIRPGMTEGEVNEIMGVHELPALYSKEWEVRGGTIVVWFRSDPCSAFNDEAAPPPDLAEEAFLVSRKLFVKQEPAIDAR
jgi:hypothetical protein